MLGFFFAPGLVPARAILTLKVRECGEFWPSPDQQLCSQVTTGYVQLEFTVSFRVQVSQKAKYAQLSVSQSIRLPSAWPVPPAARSNIPALLHTVTATRPVYLAPTATACLSLKPTLDYTLARPHAKRTCNQCHHQGEVRIIKRFSKRKQTWCRLHYFKVATPPEIRERERVRARGPVV